jgi:glucose/arabinose dehydrogenase
MKLRGALVLVLVLASCSGRTPSTKRVTGGAETPTPPSPSPTPPPSPTAAATAAPAGLRAARIKMTTIARLDQPVAFEAPAGDDTLYVAEKTGRLKSLRGGRTDTVLDLSGEVSTGSEQGLLGVAISADRAYLYVDFTDRDGDTHVREYALRDGRADASTAREVLTVDQPYANHNGGQILFGPDGKLYIALGDGGSGGDPHGNGQNLNALLGKLLRIDPRPSGGQPYGVPADNPFAGRPGARGEIWAYGLRNPWRFTFDRATGDLWIADVGQGAWEEIDRAPRSSKGGENYGWNRLEGKHQFEGAAPAGHVPPIFEYSHAGGACSITGGYVYRGTKIPALQGAYLFGDYCVGRLRALIADDSRVIGDRDLGVKVESLTSFGQDQSGELYALSQSGQVYRIDPA